MAARAHKLIIETLDRVEAEHGVTALYACESGSRAWGFASTDSDWDVRFIYARPRDAYLTLDPQREQIDLPIDHSAEDVLDIVGWDMFKALGLLRKSNPSLIEWLHSPIVYRSSEPFTSGVRDLAVRLYSPVASAFHYASMARTAANTILGHDTVVRKRYLYVMRACLAFEWVTSGRGIPPVPFAELVAAFVERGSPMAAELDALLRDKQSGKELAGGPRLPHLHAHLEERLAALPAQLTSTRESAPLIDVGAITPELDAFLRATLSR